MRAVVFIFFIMLCAQASFGVQCSALLAVQKISNDPTNAAFYMERQAQEIFRDLNLKERTVTGVKKGEYLISVNGLPHLVVESIFMGQSVFLLPKGLRVTATIKEKRWRFLGRDSVTIEGFKLVTSPRNSPYIKPEKVEVRIDDTSTETQASLQLIGSSTFQKQKGARDFQFLAVQQEAFKYLLDRLHHDLKIKDLSHINSLITENQVLRRGNLIDADIGLVRGANLRIELYQENTGINYMPSKDVPKAFERLLMKINSLGKHSSLLEVAEAYQDFIFIHPFPDGNGRTSRALLDYLLLRSKFSPINHNMETSHIMHYSPKTLSQVLLKNLRSNLE